MTDSAGYLGRGSRLRFSSVDHGVLQRSTQRRVSVATAAQALMGSPWAAIKVRRNSLANLLQTGSLAARRERTRQKSKTARPVVTIALVPETLLYFGPPMAILAVSAAVAVGYTLEYDAARRPHELWTFWYWLFLCSLVLICYALVVCLVVPPAKAHLHPRGSTTGERAPGDGSESF